MPQKDNALPKIPIQKKDKLKKAERILAEKHFVDFGLYIYRLERNSSHHNLYLPRSSYFPSLIITLILDHLLVIHFPSQLEDILKKSWMHYSIHGTALFDSIITIQTVISTQRSSKQGVINAKRRNTRRQGTDLIEDNSDSQPSLPDPAPEVEQAINQSPIRKRRAPEEITNVTKRLRAPRATQLSVAQVFEEFGPKYRTRQRGVVAEVLSGTGEKENEPTWSSLRKH